MSVQETIKFYKGEGDFKDSDFQKRQEIYNKQNNNFTSDEKLEGAQSVKEQMERLQARKEGKEEEKIGRFVSANKMDSVKLTDDIEIKEVYLVTRELEENGDSFEIYEIYDKDGNILLKTDKDRNIIAEPALQKMYTPEQIEELQTKIMMRMQRTNPETGKKEDCLAVSDKLNLNKDPDELKKDMEDNKENTIYNKVKDKDEKQNIEEETELTENEIEEKTDGQIVDTIEDPNFYQIIPFAKYKTYLLRDSEGYKFVDGQGNEIKGMEQQQRDVYVDDYKTDNVIEKQKADMVFTTGRNDNNMAVAIKNGRINIVDVQKGMSQQLDSAGYSTDDKEKEETRENITERDTVAQDIMGESDVTREFLIDFLNKECRTFSNSQIDELYNNCIKDNVKQEDITTLRQEVNHILEENEKDDERDNEHDRGERIMNFDEDEKNRMRRMAGLN